jgi:hypothetical protein
VAAAAGAAAKEPFVHMNDAEPVARPIASLTAVLLPEATGAADVALQVLPATVQLTAAGAQAAAGAGVVTQVAAGAASGVVASAPSIHAKNAEPVVGTVRSLVVALAPETVAAVLALQVLPLTVQLTVFAVHWAWTGAVVVAQVAAGAARGVAANAPLVHEKNATPVVGVALSKAVALAPEAAAATLALQVLPATVQLTDVAPQSTAGVVTAVGVVTVTGVATVAGVTTVVGVVTVKEDASVVELEPPPPHETKKIITNNELANSAIRDLLLSLRVVSIGICNDKSVKHLLYAARRFHK